MNIKRFPGKKLTLELRTSSTYDQMQSVMDQYLPMEFGMTIELAKLLDEGWDITETTIENEDAIFIAEVEDYDLDRGDSGVMYVVLR